VPDKERLRESVWDDLEDSGVARFPFPPQDRIPNVAGAAAAADRAMALDALADADAVKANPDAPQLPLRRALLRQGTTVYMAVPRLRDDRPFVELDPADVTDPEAAPTVSHMDEYGRQVGPDAVPELDAVVVGSVAVTAEGARVGKGEGFSDIEFAVLAELGAVTGDTPVVTTVHDRQVVSAGAVEPDPHDVPLAVICTPTRTIRIGAPDATPTGIDWSKLDAEDHERIPVLGRLAGED
jgi:5-formyltetrahydrofolate cyclo-ligase